MPEEHDKFDGRFAVWSLVVFGWEDLQGITFGDYDIIMPDLDAVVERCKLTV